MKGFSVLGPLRLNAPELPSSFPNHLRAEKRPIVITPPRHCAICGNHVKVCRKPNAADRKYAGRQTRKGGTLGVDQAAEKGLKIVQELNAILTKKLRKTDPVLLGVWQAAARLEQPPRRKKEEQPATPSSLPRRRPLPPRVN
jgi:hypothetical protein